MLGHLLRHSVPSQLLEQAAPALTCALSTCSQRLYAAQAAAAQPSSRSRKRPATAAATVDVAGDKPQKSSTSSSGTSHQAAAGLHVSEAMPASAVRAAGSSSSRQTDSYPDPVKRSMLQDTMARVNKRLG